MDRKIVFIEDVWIDGNGLEDVNGSEQIVAGTEGLWHYPYENQFQQFEPTVPLVKIELEGGRIVYVRESHFRLA